MCRILYLSLPFFAKFIPYVENRACACSEGYMRAWMLCKLFIKVMCYQVLSVDLMRLKK